MGTLVEKLRYALETKTEIRSAISAKGSSCETDCFREYPDRILAIPSGDPSGDEPILQEIAIQENGVYEPDSTCDGFNRVIVNVPTSGGTTLPRAEEEEF